MDGPEDDPGTQAALGAESHGDRGLFAVILAWHAGS